MLKFEDFRIDCNNKPLFSGLNFAIESKAITSIVGPSGSGKTTILKSIIRMLDDQPEFKVSGSIIYDSLSICDSSLDKYLLRRKIGLVFQKPTIFPGTIYRNVIFGVNHLKSFNKKVGIQIAEKALREAYLWDEVKDRLFSPAHKLSLGQQQRMAIARTLAIGCEVLLMDEPTSSLDVLSSQKIEELMLHLAKEKTVILVTHNMSQAKKLSNSVILLDSQLKGSGIKILQSKDAIEGLEGHFFE